MNTVRNIHPPNSRGQESWIVLDGGKSGVDVAALLCGCDLQRRDLISASCDTEAVTAGILFFFFFSSSFFSLMVP